MTQTNPGESAQPEHESEVSASSLDGWSQRLVRRSEPLREGIDSWTRYAAAEVRAGSARARRRLEAWRLDRERQQCCERIGNAVVTAGLIDQQSAEAIGRADVGADCTRVTEIDGQLAELRRLDGESPHAE